LSIYRRDLRKFDENLWKTKKGTREKVLNAGKSKSGQKMDRGNKTFVFLSRKRVEQGRERRSLSKIW
jgi:hypothetical protein